MANKQVTPKDNGGATIDWDIATHTEVMDINTGIVDSNVDLIQEVAGEVPITRGQYPNGVVILNEEPRPHHKQPKNTLHPIFVHENRYYPPDETIVQIIDNHGFPCGKIITWIPL